MGYMLEGKLLEVCTCKTLCPCWVGDDPDGGTCDGTLAWHIDRGEINGLDVSGLTFGMLAHIPGNVLQGNWRVIAFVDQRASREQEAALLSTFGGKNGGPLADVAQLIGEIVSVERVPFTFEVEQGKGTLRIGDVVAADLEPFKGPDGRPTALTDTIFTTIPGSPAYVGKAPLYEARAPVLAINVNLRGHNAIQGMFRFAS